MRSNRLTIPFLTVSMVAAGACGSSSSTGTSTIPPARSMSLSFSSQPAAAALRSLVMRSDVTVTVGANTINITKAQVVVRSIKLKQTSTLVCADDDSIDDDCDGVKVGPLLVDLPLVTNGVTSLTASVPEGTYREISFKIHKPGDSDPADVAFRAANPTFAASSIRIEGTFNGQAFTFTSDLSETLEVPLTSPVVIDASNKNITVQFDLSSWFKVGGQLIDPTTANKGGVNENAVKNNIRASLHALEDDDKNGR
jgi:hypothetical protein